MHMHSKRRLGAALAIAALAPFGLAACGSDENSTGGGGGGNADKVRKLTLLVGTEPGGGFDLTARSFAQAAKDAGAANNVQVQNIPGAGNTIALARLVTQKGTPESMQVMGLGLIGGIYANKSKNTLADTTPIARLTQESEIIVVPAKSKYQTIDDLIQAWKANPRLNAGVASNPGGPDHVATMVTAKAAGIDPKQVKTVIFDGGGELNTALLGGKVDFGTTGVGEVIEQVEGGKLRALAVTAPERVEGVDVPTLKESGLDVDFVNWRGMAAPPGLSPADKEKLIEFATAVHASPEWKATLEKNKWTDFFQTGDEFKAFANSETQRVADVMTELGLATS